MKPNIICAHADIRPEHYRFTRSRAEDRRSGYDLPLLKEAEPRASWCQIAVYAVAALGLCIAVMAARAAAFRFVGAF